jgi:type 1 glutamine amidotransferase
MGVNTFVGLAPRVEFSRRMLRRLCWCWLIVACCGGFSALMHAAAIDSRPKLVLLLAETEYGTNRTVPAFAARYLEKDFRIIAVNGSMDRVDHRFDRIEELNDADLLLVSVVRRTPPPEQLEVVRRYVMAGKPIVGIRTAGHAFVLNPGKTPAPGNADWPAWDAEVIGGNYTGSHRYPIPAAISAVDATHPILRGVDLPLSLQAGLYKVKPLQPGTHVLLLGTIPEKAEEPAAWTFTHKWGGRVFYTSLGVAANFEVPAFNQLLHNGVLWAAGRIPSK